MVEGIVTIKNPTGLHARPAGAFCTQAQRYESTVRLMRAEVENPREYDGKSILGILMGKFAVGTAVKIVCDGPDEDKALRELMQLVNSFVE